MPPPKANKRPHAALILGLVGMPFLFVFEIHFYMKRGHAEPNGLKDDTEIIFDMNGMIERLEEHPPAKTHFLDVQTQNN